MTCHTSGRWPTMIMGFGRSLTPSRIRKPYPPQNSTTFMRCPRLRRPGVPGVCKARRSTAAEHRVCDPPPCCQSGQPLLFRIHRPSWGRVQGTAQRHDYLTPRAGSGVDPHQTAGALVLEQPDVGVDHDMDQFGRAHRGLPAEDRTCLRVVADEGIDLARAFVAIVMLDISLPVQPHVLECHRDEVADA